MQVEQRSQQVNHHLHHDQRSRLFARIPPHIDLTAVTVTPSSSSSIAAATEAENRCWKMTNGKNVVVASTGNSFNKPLHVKTTNIENTICVKMGTDLLPIDPRDWTRQEVKKWILYVGRSEGIEVEHIAEKFKMNGKALCLMSVEMFMSRFPTGGKMLYRDFRLRLTRALSM